MNTYTVISLHPDADWTLASPSNGDKRRGHVGQPQ